jgi:hypothetical protein
LEFGIHDLHTFCLNFHFHRNSNSTFHKKKEIQILRFLYSNVFSDQRNLSRPEIYSRQIIQFTQKIVAKRKFPSSRLFDTKAAFGPRKVENNRALRLKPDPPP